MAELENWSPEQIHQALSNREIVLIDVRTPQEYMFEHIEGALLAPMAFFSAASLPGQESKRIVLHCGSGVRSAKVAQACLAAGMEKIAHMQGGFAAWKQAGLPFVGTDMSSGGPMRVAQRGLPGQASPWRRSFASSWARSFWRRTSIGMAASPSR